jgi:predicted transcriptional regulator YheO
MTRGIPITQWADRLGVSEDRVYRYLSGEEVIPDYIRKLINEQIQTNGQS